MLEPSPSPVATEEAAPFGRGATEVADEAAAFRVGRTKRIGIAGWLAMAWLALVLVGAIVLPMVMSDTPNPENAGVGMFKVSGHPLGFDLVGNDMLRQLAAGARNSLIVSVGAIVVGLFIGGTLGLIAGYRRGRADTVLTGFFNIMLAIPQFLLAVSLVSVLANDTLNSQGIPQPASSQRRLVVLVIALGIVSIPILARITRANTLQWAQREFVLAARAQGAKHGRVMLRELLPNVLPAMFSIALLGIAVAMVAEGGLSIFGVGVHLPAVSWGNMIAVGRANLRDTPHIVFEPVFCIFMTVLSLNYLGDIVRARFDVRESVL
jgi:peptide/nickel transport system permease protein